jgi:hypothetical protein
VVIHVADEELRLLEAAVDGEGLHRDSQRGQRLRR